MPDTSIRSITLGYRRVRLLCAKLALYYQKLVLLEGSQFHA